MAAHGAEQVDLIADKSVYKTSLSKHLMMKTAKGLWSACSRAQAPMVKLYDGATCEKLQMGADLAGIMVAAKDVRPDRLILHFHGGAHCMGTVWVTRELIGRLSAATKSRVISVEYRLAPEHPFPAGLDDALGAWRWVCKEHPGIPVALAGDSAGGNLAFALLVKLAQLQEMQPVACVTMSPWLLLDHDKCMKRSTSRSLDSTSTASISSRVAEKFENEWIIGSSRCVGRYVQDHSPTDPLVSPLLAGEDLVARFPPVLIHAAEGEPLAADARDMALLCERSGATAQVELFPGSMHCFQALPFKEHAKSSLQKMDAFLERYWTRSEAVDT